MELGHEHVLLKVKEEGEGAGGAGRFHTATRARRAHFNDDSSVTEALNSAAALTKTIDQQHGPNLHARIL